MGEIAAQEFLLVGVEVDGDEASRGRERARGLGQRPGRVVEEMQDLMNDDEVVAVALDRRRVDVALPELHVAKARLVDAAARQRQHRRALIDADGADRARSEQFQHAPGAGAQIEQAAERLFADERQKRRLDPFLGRVQGADAVPVGRLLGEIGRGLLAPRLARDFEPGAVAGEHGVVGIEPADAIADEVAARVGEAEERPGALALADRESGFGEELQVPRHPRLGLPKDGDEFADGQLGFVEQAKNAQPRLFSGRFQAREQGRKRGGRDDGRVAVFRHKDMFISKAEAVQEVGRAGRLGFEERGLMRARAARFPLRLPPAGLTSRLMRAMVFHRAGERLVMEERPEPAPGPGQVRVRVEACGVCRTDLHVIDGDLPDPKLPIVPGHEIVGRIEAAGDGAQLRPGARVGVPWLGHTCGQCPYCRSARENLCDAPLFTGYTRDGGFATHVIADADFAFPLGDDLDPVAAAPLLCAGLIGWRSLKAAGETETIGLYGFGAAAHIVAQVCRWQGRRVFAFTRAGDAVGQDFARSMGAQWAGGSDERPPAPLDAAILFATVGALVPAALAAVRKGGRVVCGGIHMTDIPSFPYRLLWEERSVVSVANLTRADGEEFLALAPRVPVRTTTTPYPLLAANEALDDLRAGRLEGAAVLVP